ncbi:hypothetical protein RC083_01890 [Pseudoalteromonas haloplanktis]|uniref:HEAT repeat domain-containing protein n=1 Tax=Pseudoalteromonas haloplanktis TaxID=228 RepID=A0ABU1B8S8_PSEHA|nr:hypothetical protein [Pseudoalteromonas haloplanktis]MDQ9090339.1 hypothetical protein [Pseudoalteromonas haloplanktis]
MTKKNLLLIMAVLAGLSIYYVNIQKNLPSVSDLPTPKNKGEQASTASIINSADLDNLELKQVTISQDEVQANYLFSIEKSLRLKNEQERINQVSHYIVKWIEQDPYFCLSWLLSQPQNTEISLYTNKAIQALIVFDLDRSGQVILDFEQLRTNQSLVNEYITAAVKIDPYATLEWLHYIDNRQVYKDAELVLLQTWANQSPLNMLDYVIATDEISASSRQQALTHAALQLSKNKPQNLVDDFYSYPQEVQPNLAYSIVSQWPAQNLDELLEWLYLLDEGDVKDQAIRSYIDYVGVENPSSQMRYLIDKVKNSSERKALKARFIAFNV